MFGFSKKSAQKYRTALNDDALTWQVGFFKFLRDNRAQLLLGTTEKDTVILAAMVNWMFRFGDYGPKADEQPYIKPVVDGTFKDIRRVLVDESLQVEFTLAIIIAAAAQDIAIDKFKSHFDRLCELDITKCHINIYGLEDRLAEEHKQYYHYMQYRKQA